MKIVALKLRDNVDRIMLVFYEYGICIMDSHLINFYKTGDKKYNKLSKCTGINVSVGVKLYNDRKMTVE